MALHSSTDYLLGTSWLSRKGRSKTATASPATTHGEQTLHELHGAKHCDPKRRLERLVVASDVADATFTSIVMRVSHEMADLVPQSGRPWLWDLVPACSVNLELELR